MVNNSKKNVYFSTSALIQLVEESLQLINLFFGVLDVLYIIINLLNENISTPILLCAWKSLLSNISGIKLLSKGS